MQVSWTEESDPKVIMDLVLGENGLGQLISSSSSPDESDPSHSDRQRVFKADMLAPFLQQDSGTLILVLGFVGAGGLEAPEQQQAFQKLLQECEQLAPTVPQGKKSPKQSKPPELLLYMRHKTALGQPFTREALEAGGFPEVEIGTVFSNTPHALFTNCTNLLLIYWRGVIVMNDTEHRQVVSSQHQLHTYKQNSPHVCTMTEFARLCTFSRSFTEVPKIGHPLVQQEWP